MMIKKFDEFKLNEIGDRIKAPHILKRLSWPSTTMGKNGTTFFYNIEIQGDTYQVVIQILEKGDATALKIDFGKLVKDNLSVDMTNDHIMLEVMSNLVGVVKEWLQDYPGNKKIVSIIVGGKSEIEGDGRRSRIYDAIIKKNVERFGVKIKEVVDITSEWVKEVPEDRLSKVLKYRIEPITLEQMRKHSEKLNE